jgi:type II secretory pathway pseudopilin PulG
MCNPVAATIAVVGGLASGVSYTQQRKAARAQERAQAQNLAAQEKLAADAAKAEANKRRTPNYAALYDKNSIAAGVGSTVLTGAGGVSNGLSLGKNTLLGGGS